MGADLVIEKWGFSHRKSADFLNGNVIVTHAALRNNASDGG